MTTVASPRTIESTWKSRPTIKAPASASKRALGQGETLDLYPFLLLDDFRGDSPESIARLPLAPTPRHGNHYLCA